MRDQPINMGTPRANRQQNISLLIPTKNRSEYLTRLLRYYSRVGFEGKLLILDSSQDPIVEVNKVLVEDYSDKLNIEYFLDQSLTEWQACKYLVDNVTTEFVAELHDDNFLVPQGLVSCIEFLEANIEYSACRGIGLSIKTINSSVHGPLRKCAIKKQPQSELNSAMARYLNFMDNYSDIHFAVHRTGTYRQALMNADKDDWFFFKILSTAYIFIIGKVKALDKLCLVRHIQDRPYTSSDYDSIYDWFNRPTWREHLAIHRKFIVSALMSEDNLSADEATAIFKDGFMLYLAHQLGGRFLRSELRRRTIATKAISRIMQVLMQLVRFLTSWKMRLLNQDVLKNQLLSHSKYVFKDLLRKNSKHYKDFLPIYESITLPPVSRSNNNSNAKLETVGELLERYEKQDLLSNQSQNVEGYHLENLKSYFGGLEVSQLTPKEVATYRDIRLKSITQASLKQELTTFSRVLTVASNSWGISTHKDLEQFISLLKVDYSIDS